MMSLLTSDSHTSDSFRRRRTSETSQRASYTIIVPNESQDQRAPGHGIRDVHRRLPCNCNGKLSGNRFN
jgi:hypothetical protein